MQAPAGCADGFGRRHLAYLRTDELMQAPHAFVGSTVYPLIAGPESVSRASVAFAMARRFTAGRPRSARHEGKRRSSVTRRAPGTSAGLGRFTHWLSSCSLSTVHTFAFAARERIVFKRHSAVPARQVCRSVLRSAAMRSCWRRRTVEHFMHDRESATRIACDARRQRKTERKDR